METGLDRRIVEEKIRESGLPEVGRASIRQLVRLVDDIVGETGYHFVRMEMGVPGLPAAPFGIEAEKQALDTGCASVYPNIQGVPEFKREAARFVTSFLGIEADPQACLPCTGSLGGSFVSFLVLERMFEGRNKVLFFDPGFPVHKAQTQVLGIPSESLEVYDHRGPALEAKLESLLATGEYCALLFSNPNNPSWICLTERELEVIGRLCTRYDVIALEDLAYFGMDFRRDISEPGVPPFQATVARYTENYIILLSSSKAFSFAGERIGVIVISPSLFARRFAALEPWFRTDLFGRAFVFGASYAVSAGVNHSAQLGLAGIMKAASDGRYRFLDDVKVYAERAKRVKKIFLERGFSLVYDHDEDEPLADGFFFTVSYPGFSGVQLVEELLYYGISALSLAGTGSRRLEGIRVCVSGLTEHEEALLAERLTVFQAEHSTVAQESR